MHLSEPKSSVSILFIFTIIKLEMISMISNAALKYVIDWPLCPFCFVFKILHKGYDYEAVYTNMDDLNVYGNVW